MTFSDNVASLEPSATLALSARARSLQEEGRSIMDLSAGEPVYGTPPFAADAGIEAIRAGKTGYPPTPGIPELRESVAEYLDDTTAASPVDASRILISAGVKQALFNCLFSLFGPDDEVLVPSPYWTSYLPQVRLARATPVVVATDWERGFRLEPEKLERLRTPRTRGLILNSPGNPSGAVYSRDLLEEVAKWASAHDIWVLSDEIYRRFHYGDGPAPSLFDLDDLPERTVVFDGISKTFAMTGWRIGFAAGPASLIGKATDLQSQTTSGAVTPAQHAAAAVLGRREERERAVRKNLKRLRTTRELGLELLAEAPGLRVEPPGGGIFFYARVETGAASMEVAEELLLEAGVACIPGEAFGSPGHLRFNFAVEPEVLEEGLERLVRHFRGG